MGAALSNAIKSIDGSSDAEKETKDALNALFELGKSRNEAAFAHATSDAMKVYAPVQKLLLQRQSIIASATNNTDGIVTGIKGAIGNLMKGQILDGFVPRVLNELALANMCSVTDLISNALNVVLGSSSGQISQSYTYALIATDLGALLRIDVDVYSFEVYSQGLQSHAKNMTAITSLVSTVNPNGLTLSDIRGVVSMSYGGSPIETQQNIFNLVKSAWENDRKVSVGQALTSADHERYSSLLVPSKYEQQMESRGTLGLTALSLGPPPKQPMGRLELIGALDKSRAAKAKSQGVSLASLADQEPKMVDIFIWFHLVRVIDEPWLRHIGGALKGFEEDQSFKYIGPSGGRSGSAISFQCQVSGEPELFDKCIAYCDDIIIPSIRKAEYLTSNVSSVALQYSHPTQDGSGMPTAVVFKQNGITNSTGDVITFYHPDDLGQPLSLQPNETKALSGPVIYIAGTPPPTSTPQLNGGSTDEGKTSSTPKPVVKSDDQPKQWITYQSIDSSDILTGMPAKIQKIQSGGYRIDINNPKDVIMQIKYSAAASS